MREFNYENQGTSTWLVCDLSAEKIDTMSLGMITNNQITGFVPALYMQQDSRKYLKYNISARLSLKQYFMGTVSKKRLIGVFTSIVSALTGAEEYMIDVGSVLLDAEYIYVDVSSGKAEVLCVPVLDLDRPLSDPGLFFKNIMFCTQFDSGEDCDYVARIINYLNGTPAISLPAFGSLLRELENVTMVLADRNLPQAAADVQEQVSLSARPVPDRGTGIQPQDGMAPQPGMQAPPAGTARGGRKRNFAVLSAAALQQRKCGGVQSAERCEKRKEKAEGGKRAETIEVPEGGKDSKAAGGGTAADADSRNRRTGAAAGTGAGADAAARKRTAADADAASVGVPGVGVRGAGVICDAAGYFVWCAERNLRPHSAERQWGSHSAERQWGLHSAERGKFRRDDGTFSRGHGRDNGAWRRAAEREPPGMSAAAENK